MSKKYTSPKYIVLLFAFSTLFLSTSLSQGEVKMVQLDSVNYTLTDTLLNGFIHPKKEAIIFFCPSNYEISKKEYSSELGRIVRSKRVGDSISVMGVLYENKNAASQNPKFDSVQISELDCFLVLKDSINLVRASDQSNTFNYFIEGLPTGFYGIKMRDGVVCPKTLATKISAYNRFLYEVFSPKYSEKELIEMTNKRIDELHQLHLEEINAIEQKILNLEAIIREMDERKRDKKN